MFYIDFIYYRLAGFTLIEILSHWTGTVPHDFCYLLLQMQVLLNIRHQTCRVGQRWNSNLAINKQWLNESISMSYVRQQQDRIDSIAYCRLPIHDLWIGSQQRPRSKRRPWLEVNNAAAPLPRFWEQSLHTHSLQPAGWLWSLFCGNSLRRGRSDADDFIQPDTPWRLARENGSDAAIVWNVWSAIALK